MGEDKTDTQRWRELTNLAPEKIYKPLYVAEDTDSLPASFPGFSPYTRGAYPSMYRGRPWTVRQYAGFSSAAESNRFYRQALKGGQRGLSIAFDLPTHRGYDSDNPRAAGDVGKAGVAIDTVEDMKILFADIPLNKVSVSMTMNGAVLPIMACFLVAAEEQKVARADLTGTIQNDILKEYIVRNTFIYPPHAGMRVALDTIEFITAEMPKFNSISVSGYHFQEAGADPALELAFTLADALAYLNAAQRRNLSVDAIAPRLSFFFGMGMNFLLEIAKLRAARTLWAELMQKYNPQNPKSKILRTHCQTSGYSLTQQRPLNNIVRTTVEALAAILGGTQSLHTNAYDEAVCIPTDKAAQVARDTQLILQHETDITKVIDPLGGSYAIESLTAHLKQTAHKIITDIASQGGMVEALEYAKQKIEESAAEKQARVDSGKETIIGVNKFKTEQTEEELDFRDIDTARLQAEQIASLQKIRKTRPQDKVNQSLQTLRNAASADANENLLPFAVDAIKLRATVGEVSDVLAQVFGRHQPATSINVSSTYIDTYGAKDAEIAEIQKQVQDFAQRTGRHPRLLVAKLGQDGHDRGLQVIAAGFSNFGFDVDLAPLFQTPAEVARYAVESDVHVIGVSTHTAGHKVLVPALFSSLRDEHGAEEIAVVVGGIVPPPDRVFLKGVGVKAVFAPGTPIPECVKQVMQIIS